MAIQRLFVTKRESFNLEAQRMLQTLQQELSMPATDVTIYERYDIENLDAKDLESAKNLIFSEPPVDTVLEEIPSVQGFVFAVEYVPGQYDQRADNPYERKGAAAQSNVFLCSHLHPATSCVVLAYMLSKALSQKNRKMSSNHTTLTLLIPAKRALMYQIH